MSTLSSRTPLTPRHNRHVLICSLHGQKYLKCAADGLLVPISFGRAIPAEYADYAIIGGIKAEDWDGFHDFVLWDELYRGGAISSIFVGLTVGTCGSG